MKNVTLKGLNKWGQERVKRHGPTFQLKKRGVFRGQPAILCKGLRPAYRDGSAWIGWFLLDVEASIADTTD